MKMLKNYFPKAKTTQVLFVSGIINCSSFDNKSTSSDSCIKLGLQTKCRLPTTVRVLYWVVVKQSLSYVRACLAINSFILARTGGRAILRLPNCSGTKCAFLELFHRKRNEDWQNCRALWEQRKLIYGNFFVMYISAKKGSQLNNDGKNNGPKRAVLECWRFHWECAYNKQLLEEVEHDIMNYQKPRSVSAEAEGWGR